MSGAGFEVKKQEPTKKVVKNQLFSDEEIMNILTIKFYGEVAVSQTIHEQRNIALKSVEKWLHKEPKFGAILSVIMKHISESPRSTFYWLRLCDEIYKVSELGYQDQLMALGRSIKNAPS